LQHSKNLRLDRFYIGEHRTFTDDIDSALARQVVLSFSGEGLTIRARLERQPRQRDAPQNEGATEGDDGADGPETAMGDFLVVDTTVEASNMLVTAVSTRGDDAKQQPAHPIGSAAKMVYVKGESLQLEAEGPASGRLGLHPPRGQDRREPEHTDSTELHHVLLRQKSHTHTASTTTMVRVAHHLHQDTHVMHDLKPVLEDLVHSGIIRDRKYRFKDYKSVFLGSEFVDWAIVNTFCRERADAIRVGQALMDAKFVRRLDGDTQAFRDDQGFYRVRKDPKTIPDSAGVGSAETLADEPRSLTWSRKWGSQRPGRRVSMSRRGSGLREEAALETSEPDWKLHLKELCLEWNQETREIINAWGTLFTLATRSHQGRSHAKVVVHEPAADSGVQREASHADLSFGITTGVASPISNRFAV